VLGGVVRVGEDAAFAVFGRFLQSTQEYSCIKSSSTLALIFTLFRT
jgi:hypothetical protein